MTRLDHRRTQQHGTGQTPDQFNKFQSPQMGKGPLAQFQYRKVDGFFLNRRCHRLEQLPTLFLSIYLDLVVCLNRPPETKFQRSGDLSCNKTSTGVGENSLSGKGDPSSSATEDIKKSLSSVFSMTCKATSSDRVSIAKDKAYLNALADSSEKSMGINILFSLRMISSCYAVPIVSNSVCWEARMFGQLFLAGGAPRLLCLIDGKFFHQGLVRISWRLKEGRSASSSSSKLTSNVITLLL